MEGTYKSNVLYPEAFIEKLDDELEYRIMMFVESASVLAPFDEEVDWVWSRGCSRGETSRHQVADSRADACMIKFEELCQ